MDEHDALSHTGAPVIILTDAVILMYDWGR